MAKKCVACDKAKKMAKGGSTSAFAKLAPPYNKVTFADKIAGAKKKMGGTLAKKNMGGDDSTSIANTTIPAKQISMAVEKNPDYKKISKTDPKTGKDLYMRKSGLSLEKVPAGTHAPSGTYAPDAVSRKAVVPTSTYGVKPISKKGGAVMANKKMGGTTKTKKK